MIVLDKEVELRVLVSTISCGNALWCGCDAQHEVTEQKVLETFGLNALSYTFMPCHTKAGRGGMVISSTIVQVEVNFMIA